MICKNCGHEISMNKICERPIQAATDMLKHMAAHNASRAFAAVESVIRPEPEVSSSLSHSPRSLRCRGWLHSPNHPTTAVSARASAAASFFLIKRPHCP